MAYGMSPVRFAVFAAALALTPCLGAGRGLAYAQPLGDPMRPPAFLDTGSAVGDTADQGEDSMTLQTTIVSSGRRVATINGKPLRIGDRVGQARIIAIGPDSVTLREAGATRVLKLIRGVDVSAAGTATAPASHQGAKERSR